MDDWQFFYCTNLVFTGEDLDVLTDVVVCGFRRQSEVKREHESGAHNYIFNP